MVNKQIVQIGILAGIIFIGLFVFGSSFNLLSIAPYHDEITGNPVYLQGLSNKGIGTFTLYGTCNSDSDCSSTACIKWNGDDDCDYYMKWSSSSGPDCAGSYCNYNTMVGCYYDSACTNAVSSCSTSTHYCCGTPQSDGSCTPHSVNSNYYDIYRVNSDCSHTFIKECDNKCTVNSDGSLPNSNCPNTATNYEGYATLTAN